MKGKKDKIKQYSVFTDRRTQKRRRWLKAGGVVVALALLFGAGWMLAKSGFDWIGGGASLPDVVVPSQMDFAPPEGFEPEGDASDGGGSGEAGKVPALPPEESESSSPAAIPATGGWARLTPADLAGAALEDTITRLQGQGVAYAVVPLKDSEGHLYYGSTLAAATGSIQDAGFDAAGVAARLAEAGIQPVAQVYAYEDRLAPYNDRSMAIQLSSGNEYLWLNNSPAAGGVPWLNPYATGAQDYIAGVLQEVAALGYTNIEVCGLQFPSGYGLEQADLSLTGNVIGEAEQLGQTMAGWQQMLAQQGVVCWFSYPVDVLLGGSAQLTGTAPLGFGGNNYIATEVTAQSLESELLREAAARSIQALALEYAGGAVPSGSVGTGTSVKVMVFEE